MLLTLLFSATSFAMIVEMQEEIAQEMFDERAYSKALKKCSKLLKKHKSSICSTISKKSKTILNKRKLKRENKKKEEKRIQAEKTAKKIKERKVQELLIAKKKEEEEKKKNSYEYIIARVCQCLATQDHAKHKVQEEKTLTLGTPNYKVLKYWGRSYKEASKFTDYYLLKMERLKYEIDLSVCVKVKYQKDSFNKCFNGAPITVLQ